MSNSSSTSQSNDGFDASGFTYGVAFVLGLIFLLATIAFACFRIRNIRTPNLLINIVAGVPSSSQSHRALGRHVAEALEQGHRHVDVRIDTSYENYPKMPYSDEVMNKSSVGGGCTICLGDYKESEMLRVLPGCGHVFHQVCVDPWLMLHSTCPICRKSLPQEAP
ncbi:hypothetical protein PIB30_045444 [Stylosanthes scabra]|uniref:RING-type domain-containing protein n=1 Tax=Stylosanthes scabra TaxID=79078 RepID=A0ABU6SG56_9FABA|nr:hypothetical protein [Stylosanthes scabra]